MSVAENTQIEVQRTYERTFARADVIFDQGDPGDVLFVIQSGEVELSRTGLSGRQIVGRLGPGEFFGEMSVVVGECRTARAVAVAATSLLELDAETLEAMCIERPEIAIRIIRRLTDRLIDAERRLSALGVDDLLRPMVRIMLRRAKPLDGDAGVRVPGKLRDLAVESGLSMLEAHRAIHQLLDQKLIQLTNNELYVSDLESLSGCLDAPG